jgi:hypothetical protein
MLFNFKGKVMEVFLTYLQRMVPNPIDHSTIMDGEL